MNIKIAIAYHKPALILRGKNFLPLHVGKTISHCDLEIQGDNTGDNISEKNPLYCELTGIYWLWKNTTADYKGLMHYRRIFTIQKYHWLYKFRILIKYYIRQFVSPFYPIKALGVTKDYPAGVKENYVKNAKRLDSELESLLNGVNIIVPEPMYEYISTKCFFMQNVPVWALTLTTDIIKNEYPEFIDVWQKSLKSYRLYQRNMFIMDNCTFEDYCKRLFNILQIHEQRSVSECYILDIYKEKVYSRLSGYIAELFTSAYIMFSERNGKIVKEVPLMIFDNSQEYAER